MRSPFILLGLAAATCNHASPELPEDPAPEGSPGNDPAPEVVEVIPKEATPADSLSTDGPQAPRAAEDPARLRKGPLRHRPRCLGRERRRRDRGCTPVVVADRQEPRAQPVRAQVRPSTSTSATPATPRTPGTSTSSATAKCSGSTSRPPKMAMSGRTRSWSSPAVAGCSTAGPPKASSSRGVFSEHLSASDASRSNASTTRAKNTRAASPTSRG